ncbi:hypothetical protein Patl1_27995 [Pistacia atlantica]|uniref:Uncharacterized protein n=1 Tax=Pistacia atlantica TaxID=434234 RepID=A0ACC1BC67_9ROSI|nr:hypothetical protein Patl1_27995 [Pistacia atlantica]
MYKKTTIHIGLSSSVGVESRIHIKIEYRLVHCLLQLGTFLLPFVPYTTLLAGFLMEIHNVVVSLLVKPWSKLKRLDFRGFYAMVLHKGDEIVSVATVRIHGFKVAEMPLVATPFQYRRQGMCRLLLHELEKLLIQLGVERLVLPSILQLQKAWEDSFGFSELLHSQRRELFGYPFLAFSGTKMLQKFLSNSSTAQDINGLVGKSRDFDRNTSVVSKQKDKPDSGSRYSGLCYKRKSKRITGKENMMNSCNLSAQRYGYIYKRRRILGC